MTRLNDRRTSERRKEGKVDETKYKPGPTMRAIGSAMLAFCVLFFAPCVEGAQRIEQRENTSDACRELTPIDGTIFDLDEYVSREWYVAQQRVTRYQSERDLFCVRANYTLRDEKTIVIWNTATRNGVNGTMINSKGWIKLRGVLEDESVPSKLSVGLWFLPTFLYGSYWVVATDVQSNAAEFDEKGYSWAIVSGGPLDSVTADGLCVPSGGLWLFVRDPKDVQTDVVDEMKKAARALGIDTDSLTPVVQEGCTYPQ